MKEAIGLFQVLGVKLGLLEFEFRDQFLDPANRKRIRNRGGDPAVVLNFIVEFDALVTHGLFRL
jgi:hypothetical protein